jgi:hypothetical protein
LFGNTDPLGPFTSAQVDISFFDADANSGFAATGASTSAPVTQELGAVPLPAALPLFGSGLALIGFVGWRRKRKNAAARAAA